MESIASENTASKKYIGGKLESLGKPDLQTRIKNEGSHTIPLMSTLGLGNININHFLLIKLVYIALN